MAEATAEQHLLADAILRHRQYPLATALRRVLLAAGEYVPDEDAELLYDYAASVFIATALDGFHLVSRDEVPLLGIGPLELFAEPGNPALLTRCAVWYGPAAQAEWKRRMGEQP